MRYRQLSESQDYTFGNAQANYLQDVPEAVAQAVVTRLRLLTGEWFLDVTEGTPYQAGVLGKQTLATASEAIRERILGTQGLVEILEFEATEDRETRTLTVTAKIATIYGEIEINEVL